VPEALNPVTEGRTSTNDSSQSSLNTIVVLELVRDSGLLPTDAAAANNFVVRSGAGGRGGRGGAAGGAAPATPDTGATTPAAAPATPPPPNTNQ